MPSVESAITTAAGPQLLSDCHTCFISGNTARAGGAPGVGSTSPTTTGAGAGALIAATGSRTVTLAARSPVGVVSTMAALSAGSAGCKATPPARTTPMVRARAAAEAPRPLICIHRVALPPVPHESRTGPDTYHTAISPTTLGRGRLRDTPPWSRALAAPRLLGRRI